MPNVDRCCQINEINPNHAMRFLQKNISTRVILRLTWTFLNVDSSY
jgi:hypothetical protein